MTTIRRIIIEPCTGGRTNTAGTVPAAEIAATWDATARAAGFGPAEAAKLHFHRVVMPVERSFGAVSPRWITGVPSDDQLLEAVIQHLRERTHASLMAAAYRAGGWRTVQCAVNTEALRFGDPLEPSYTIRQLLIGAAQGQLEIGRDTLIVIVKADKVDGFYWHLLRSLAERTGARLVTREGLASEFKPGEQPKPNQQHN